MDPFPSSYVRCFVNQGPCGNHVGRFKVLAVAMGINSNKDVTPRYHTTQHFQQWKKGGWKTKPGLTLKSDPNPVHAWGWGQRLTANLEHGTYVCCRPARDPYRNKRGVPTANNCISCAYVAAGVGANHPNHRCGGSLLT